MSENSFCISAPHIHTFLFHLIFQQIIYFTKRLEQLLLYNQKDTHFHLMHPFFQTFHNVRFLKYHLTHSLATKLP